MGTSHQELCGLPYRYTYCWDDTLCFHLWSIRDPSCVKPTEKKKKKNFTLEGPHEMTGRCTISDLYPTRRHDSWTCVSTQVGHNTVTSEDPPVLSYSHPELLTPLHPRQPESPFLHHTTPDPRVLTRYDTDEFKTLYGSWVTLG